LVSKSDMERDEKQRRFKLHLRTHFLCAPTLPRLCRVGDFGYAAMSIENLAPPPSGRLLVKRQGSSITRRIPVRLLSRLSPEFPFFCCNPIHPGAPLRIVSSWAAQLQSYQTGLATPSGHPALSCPHLRRFHATRCRWITRAAPTRGSLT
jgi:hypothetical protein